MRLRLSSKPPLPHRKIWYNIDSNKTDAPSTIYELKEQLCSNLFSDITETAQLLLSLDDFELLDDSEITVLRDGDLICVSCLQGKRKTTTRELSIDGAPPSKKVKYDNHLPSEHSAMRHQRVRASTPSSTSSSTDSSSSSDSSSNSDSESSSSSSEESSSEESVTKSPPKSRQPVLPLVPPGYGKPSTHSRNRRRRLKKKYDQLTASGVPVGKDVTPSQSNVPDEATTPPCDDLTLQTEVRNEEPTMIAHHPTPQLPIAASLRNKNKKKGFYSLTQRPVAPRIVFGEDGSRITQPASHATSEPPSTIVSQPPPLTTPSDKQERGLLPRHMFVTSVDVEEGMWGKKKRNRPNIAPAPPTLNDAEEAAVEQEVDEVNRGIGNGFSFEDAEEQWDSLPAIDKGALKAGVFLLWKELGINPTTFTPEMLLMSARLTSVDKDIVVVKHLLRPGSEELAFGLLQQDDESYASALEGDEERFSWEDIITKKCRVLVAPQANNT